MSAEQCANTSAGTRRKVTLGFLDFVTGHSTDKVGGGRACRSLLRVGEWGEDLGGGEEGRGWGGSFYVWEASCTPLPATASVPIMHSPERFGVSVNPIRELLAQG